MLIPVLAGAVAAAAIAQAPPSKTPRPASPRSPAPRRGAAPPIVNVDTRLRATLPDRQIRLGGRRVRAKSVQMDLAKGDRLSVRLASSNFAPRASLALDGREVATAEAVRSADEEKTLRLDYAAEKTGRYQLTLAARSARGKGAFVVDVDFRRDRERAKKAPRAEHVKGQPRGRRQVLEAILAAGPDFSGVMGELVGRSQGKLFYASKIVMPGSTQTTVICEPPRGCAVVGLFGAVDGAAAVQLAGVLTGVVQRATGVHYTLQTPQKGAPVRAYRFTPEPDYPSGVRVSVQWDERVYDETHGFRVLVVVAPAV